MINKIIKLQKDIYLHARPSGNIAAEAQKYQSLILLFYEEQVVDLKRAISLMNLTLHVENQIELVIDGEDEEEALQGMEKILKNL